MKSVIQSLIKSSISSINHCGGSGQSILKKLVYLHCPVSIRTFRAMSRAPANCVFLFGSIESVAMFCRTRLEGWRAPGWRGKERVFCVYLGSRACRGEVLAIMWRVPRVRFCRTPLEGHAKGCEEGTYGAQSVSGEGGSKRLLPFWSHFFGKVEKGLTIAGGGYGYGAQP